MNYFFTDNWYGCIVKFSTLTEARSAAKKQYGVSIAIHRCKDGELVEVAEASGHTPG